MLFSFFRHPVTNVMPMRSIDPRLLAKYILSGCAHNKTQDTRALLDHDARRAYKRENLDFVTAGCVVRKRATSYVMSFSGLMILDFDHVGDFDALKTWAVRQLGAVMAWRSPSGDGLKVLLDIQKDLQAERIPIDMITTSHNVRNRGIETYKYLYGLAMEAAIKEFGNDAGADMSASDITRATYLSCDFDCYVNPLYFLG